MKGLAGAIVSSMATHDRVDSDNYPTPEEATVALLKVINVSSGMNVLEPAVGDGKIARCIEALRPGVLVTGLDIRRHVYGHGEVDYLKTKPAWGGIFDWVITNPPFSQATKFIEKAKRDAPNVAMLLKADFWNASRALPLFELHPPSHIFALTWRLAFRPERGKSPLMNCIWCVWYDKPMIPDAALYTLMPKPTIDHYLKAQLDAQSLAFKIKRLRLSIDDLAEVVNARAGSETGEEVY